MGIRELLRRSDDVGDPLEAVQRERRRGRQVFSQVREIALLVDAGAAGKCFGRCDLAVRELANEAPVVVDAVVELLDPFTEKPATVTDELDGRVDLVRDPSREPADRLELLRLAKLDLDLGAACDLVAQPRGRVFGGARRALRS